MTLHGSLQEVGILTIWSGGLKVGSKGVWMRTRIPHSGPDTRPIHLSRHVTKNNHDIVQIWQPSHDIKEEDEMKLRLKFLRQKLGHPKFARFKRDINNMFLAGITQALVGLYCHELSKRQESRDLKTGNYSKSVKPKHLRSVKVAKKGLLYT